MTPAITFVSFCQQVAGMRLTPAQRVLALVSFDGVEPRDLTGRDRELGSELFGDVATVKPAARGVIALVKGARIGGTRLGAIRSLHLAVTADLSKLAAGESAFALTIAPDLRLARQARSYQDGVIAGSALRSWVIGSSAESLALQRPDGRVVRLECLPATRAGSALRGRSLAFVHFSESAFFYDDKQGYVVADEELFRAVAPRVMRGGQILLESTPWARAGLLFELFDQNFGKPRNALAVLAPTPLLRKGGEDEAAVFANIERERARDAFNFQREYLAQFADTATALLSSEDVEACRERGITQRAPRADVLAAGGYGLAVDVGLRTDHTAVTVAHVENKSRGHGAPPLRMLVVDAVTILKPKLLRRVTLDEVEQAVASLAARYGCGKVHGDIHYSDALAPRLAARGLRFVELPMSPTAQQTRAHTLAGLFGSRAVRLVDDETMVSQLKDLTLQRHPGGRESVGASRGSGHDDAADTLLLLAEVSAGLPAVGGDAGVVEIVNDGFLWDDEGIRPINARCVRRRADGSTELVGVQPWMPGAAETYREWAAQGLYTPESSAFFAQERGEDGNSMMSVPVMHDGEPARPWGQTKK